MFQNGHTPLKILLQDFQSVSDHFGTLCIKALKTLGIVEPAFYLIS